MATGMGSPAESKATDDFDPPMIPVFGMNKLTLSEGGKPALRPPPTFEPGCRLSLWRRKAELFLHNVPEHQRGSYILNLMNDHVMETLFSVGISAASSTESIWTKLQELFPEPDDSLEARQAFRNRCQKSGESIDLYASELRVLAFRAFPSSTEGQRELTILDRFTEGVHDADARRRFITDPPATLAEAIKLARRYETASKVLATKERDGVQKHQTRHHEANGQKSLVHQSPPDNVRSHQAHWMRPRRHEPNRGVRGWKPRGMERPSQQYPHLVSRESLVPSVCCSLGCDLPLLTMSVAGKKIEALVDTGASCSIIKPEFCRTIDSCTEIPKLKAANGTLLKSVGKTMLELSIDTLTVEHQFVVSADIPWPALLGHDFLQNHKCVIDFTQQSLLMHECRIAFRGRRRSDAQNTTAVIDDHAGINSQVTDFVEHTIRLAKLTRTNELHDLITKHSAAFAWKGTSLGRTSLIQHRIHTGDASPIKQNPRRLPVHYRAELNDIIGKMLKEKVIKPSKSPWASPIVLVKKKDGTLRLCVDYRRLNDVTRKDSFPLPRIDDTLEALEGAQWFSTLDLASGYWQVEIHPDDREKTAFTIPTGLYEFQTMPFGLANAPATFQRLMHNVLRDLLPHRCLVYLDDVIVYSRTLEEHWDNLDAVFARLEEAGLKLRPDKCSLLRREVHYLGHVISEAGIKSDPQKVESVRNWPRPTSVEELRRFLGLTSYYRRFVRGYAEIAFPLHRLTEKGRKFEWNEECQTAFDSLRLALTSSPVLAFPDTSETAGSFILDTDASDRGIGAVLSQVGSDGLEHVIAYASRSLNKNERNYCTTRKEMLALVTFIKHFRHLLLGRKFLARTDHQALKWLREFREPEGQVARWQEQLQEFEFDCEHRPGTKHRNADALSRRPSRAHGDCPTCTGDNVTTVTLTTASSEEWVEAQREDPETRLIYDRILRGGIKPTRSELTGASWETLCLWSVWPKLRLLDGVLYYQFNNQYPMKLIVPQSKVMMVLQKLHSEMGHVGQRKMDLAVSQRFWWPQQRRDVINFCATCKDCLQMKSPRIVQRAPLQSIAVGYPNALVSVDFMGPLPETARNNRYILVMVDHFTKWCEAIPLPSADGLTTARAIFDNWVSRWGAPEQLHSDRGSNFESVVLAELCSVLGIRKSRTTAYHPQGNGQVERRNRTLKGLLKAFTDEESTRDWDLAIPHCLLAYRAAVHTSTGQSPHFMVTGRELRLPVDLTWPSVPQDHLLATEYASQTQQKLLRAHQLARDTLSTAYRHQREYYDRKAHGDPLQPGQHVYFRNSIPTPGMPAKLHREWTGPFVIEEIYSDSTCRLIKVGDPTARPFTAHFNRLKPITLAIPSQRTGQRRITDTLPLSQRSRSKYEPLTSHPM